MSESESESESESVMQQQQNMTMIVSECWEVSEWENEWVNEWGEMSDCEWGAEVT